MTDTLILLGKGASKDMLDEYVEDFPDNEVWTLNQAVHPLSVRHFDIHHDQRFWGEIDKLPDGVASVVSPFRQKEGSESFPLEELFQTFGTVYLESTICYMAAYAALKIKRGEANWKRVCWPGCDMADACHFAYRFGLHAWVGVLIGLGVDVFEGLPPDSYIFRRFAHIDVPKTEEIFPHIYGQPRGCTEPLASRYRF